MATETIELIKILRDVTQSKSVFDRCGAELGKLGASLACVAHNKTVADVDLDCAMRQALVERWQRLFPSDYLPINDAAVSP